MIVNLVFISLKPVMENRAHTDKNSTFCLRVKLVTILQIDM